ncbi:hypothetical protein ACFLWX_01550 [Chloroflexota bacterium]
MTALEELRHHAGLDWKVMGREELKTHLKQSLKSINKEQKKLCIRLGASSIEEMERKLITGQLKGKEATSLLHQYTRMCSLVRLAEEALEELEAPDPDAIEDEFQGKRH